VYLVLNEILRSTSLHTLICGLSRRNQVTWSTLYAEEMNSIQIFLYFVRLWRVAILIQYAWNCSHEVLTICLQINFFVCGKEHSVSSLASRDKVNERSLYGFVDNCVWKDFSSISNLYVSPSGSEMAAWT